MKIASHYNHFYKIKLSTLLLFIFSIYYSQINDTPCSAIRLCETKNLNNSYPGQSKTYPTKSNCGNSKFDRTVFYKLIIKSGNKFTFKIKPSKKADYDWALWKNIGDCEKISNVKADRISLNDGIGSYPKYTSNWDTGLDISKPSKLICDEAGSRNDGLLSALDVSVGDEILLAINLAQSQNGISDYLLSFEGEEGGGGNATFLCVDEYDPFYICDINNDNIERDYDLNKVKENVIEDYLNGDTSYNIKFYTNERDLVKDINSINSINVTQSGAKIYCNITKSNKDIYASLSIDLNLVKYPVGSDREIKVCAGREDLHKYDNLVSSTPDTQVFYYDDITEAQNEGTPLEMPVIINKNKTFYALIKTNRGGCSIVQKLTVKLSDAPQVDPVVVCSGETAVFTVKNPASVIRWYDVPAGGTPIYSGSVFITRKQTNTGTSPISKNYYVEQGNTESCASERIAVTVTVNPKPIVELGPDQTVCEGTSITLDAKNPGATYLWSTGASTQRIEVKESGTYSVTVTDTKGCKNSDTIVIRVNPKPVVDLGEDQTVCEGTSITLDAKNPGATYLWSTGASTQRIEVKESGTYSVTVTDTKGCKNSDTIVIRVNPKPIVELGPDQTVCEGTSVTLDAKNPGATYLWSTGASTQRIEVKESGTYSVTVTDTKGCKNSDAIVITVNPLPVIDLGEDQTVCEGTSITLDAKNPGGTYLWNTGASTQRIEVKESGTYSVTVTDTKGCKNSDTIVITVNPKPVVDLGEDQTVCEGTSITLDAKNPGGTYLWNTGASTQRIEVKESGTYSVTVTDIKGCKNSDTIVIRVNPKPVVDLGEDQTVCEGTSITLDAKNPGATYLWSTGASTQRIEVKESGTYSVTVTDTKGCKNSNTVKVTVHPLPVVTLDGDREICEGQTATLKAEGGTWASYQWYFNTAPIPGANSATLDVTEAGEYYVQVTDTNTCEGTSNTVKVTVHPLPVVTLDDQREICEGGTTTLDAGNQWTTYQWYFNTAPIPGANNATLDVTEAGEYYVTVTDTNTCEGTSNTVKVTVHPLPQVTLDDQQICEGQTATLKAEGGIGTTYQWYFNNSPIPGANSSTLDVTQAGEYYVKVTNAHGCEGTSNIANVIVHPLPVVTLEGDWEICEGQTATLKAEGDIGTTYQWYFNGSPIPGATSATLDVTEAGKYYVKVTDTNTCEGTSNTVKVTVHPLPVVTLDDQREICEGGTTTLDAGNQWTTYQWYFNNASIMGANSATLIISEAGEYYVKVTDTNTCEGTSNITNVIVHPLPVVTLEGDREICEGQNTTLKAEGDIGTTYQWFFNGSLIPGADSAQLNVSRAGEYYVRVTDAHGCSGESNTLTLTVHPLPVVTLDGDREICEGQNTTLKAEGGTWASYQWYFNDKPLKGENNSTLTVSKAGEYYVKVTDTNTCEGTSNSVKVIVHPLPVVTLDDQREICEESTATLDAGDQWTSYQWYFNNKPLKGENRSTLVVSEAGEYYVKVTDTHTCEGTSNIVTVTVHPLPVVTLGEDQTICEGQSYLLDATDSWAAYQWFFNNTLIPGESSPTLTVSQAGEYYVRVTDAHGCSAESKPVKISVKPAPKVELGEDQIICEGQSYLLNPGKQEPGAQYKWSTGEDTPTITVSQTGTYWVEVENSFGCTSRDSIFIKVNPLPQIPLPEHLILCQGNSLVLDAGAAGKYKWSNGKESRTITITQPGEYSVTVTDIYGCSNTATTVVTESAKPVITLEPKQTFCKGETVTLDAGEQQPGATYRWSTKETTQTITVSVSGKYWVTVTNANGCSSTAFVEIDFTSPFIKEVKVNDNTAEIIAIGQHPLEYSLDKIHWQYSPIFRNLEFKVYNAYVRNALGCLSDPFPFGVLNVPNVITPNGDGINDVWELKGLDLYPGSSVKIFDRKGNLLVDSKITQGIIWDGKYLGRNVPTTSYWYIIELTDGRKLTGWLVVRNYNENDR